MDFHQRRFTGQEQDPETGLYFYNARYYNPVLGRFISPDSIVPEPGNPQSLNRYSYVENNPVNRIDPSGHFSFGKFFRSLFRAIPAIVVGVVVGVVTAGLAAPLGATAAAVVGGAVGGAAAGAANTAVNGGNLGLNVLMGAVLGGIAGGIGPSMAGYLGQQLGSQFAGVVATGAILGGAFGGTTAAISGENALDGVLGGALGGAIVAGAIYGGYKAWRWFNYANDPRTLQAFSDFEKTEFARTSEGTEILAAMRVANKWGEITYGQLPPGVRAQYSRGWTVEIVISLEVDQVHIPGRLAHEGSHYVWDQKSLPYNFQNERAAFDAGYAVDSQLGLPDAWNPPDQWIRRMYKFP